MSLKERIQKWYKREREKLSTMKAGEKLSYLFTYYKGWAIGFLLLCVLVGYVADAVTQSGKEIVLQGFFTNDEYGLFPAQTLQKEIEDLLGVQKGQRVVFDDDLYIDLEGQAREYSAASNGKIIAYMAVGELDFVVTSRSVYEHYAGDVPLKELGALLPEELRQRLEPWLVEGNDGDGTAGYVAIDMAGSRFLRDSELAGEGEYFLFVPYSAPHSEAIARFIAYCFE